MKVPGEAESADKYSVVPHVHARASGANLLANPWIVKQPGVTLARPVVSGYSYLNATIGSTLIARRAGMKLAARATPVRRTDTTPKVSASVALTP